MTVTSPSLSAGEAEPFSRAGLAIDRLLNVWLRECCSGEAPAQGAISVIAIGDARLHAFCRHMSPGGFHRWQLPVAILRNGGSVETSAPREVASLMADALSHTEKAGEAFMAGRLLAALDLEEDHAAASVVRPADLSPQGLERSLWHGHPFHPFAKSIEGFTAEDVERFAPERGGSFQLNWILADPDVCGVLSRDADAWTRAQNILADLSGLPLKSIGERLLLPVHPWQAGRLAGDGAFAALAADGRVVLTLPTGSPMLPTSSVRTVLAPGADIFLKLPVEARITNFARTNPRDHVARSMAASRVLAAVRETIDACGFDILDEPASMWIEQDLLAATTGVILREAPLHEAFVLAGLLEPSVHDGRPMLQFMGCDPMGREDIDNWLSLYVRNVVLPPLRLFARTGISVEAHSQNSLLVLEKGWPARLIVRDLEGVSVDRARFERVSAGVDLAPCVCYPGEEALERLVYYLVSSNLNQAIAAIARLAWVPEEQLWRQVAEMLVAVREDEDMMRLIASLLSSDTLPAKANFTSCYSGRGEQPAYVRIANPLRLSRAGGGMAGSRRVVSA